MKFKLVPSIFAVIIFAVLTIIFYQGDAEDDGYTLIGFPLNFYRQTRGKLTDPGFRAELGFNVGFLMIDIFALIVFVYLLNFLYSFIRTKRNQLD